MDTLHHRLAELAEDAPTGGAPAAQLWARGKRTHRVRATALAATLVAVGTVGTGIGLELADVDGDGSYPSPAGSSAIELPIASSQQCPETLQRIRLTLRDVISMLIT